MTIVCGTDFSESSGQAARVAAALAVRYNEPLQLVHVSSSSDAGLSTRLAEHAKALAAGGALIEAHVLRAIGACDLIVTQIAWPFGEHARLGIAGGGASPGELRPELEQILLRDLQDWAGTLSGQGKTEFSVRPGWGRVDTHLTQRAAEL